MSADKKPDKATQAWDWFMGTLPESVRLSMLKTQGDLLVETPEPPPEDEASEDYKRFIATLPASVAQSMNTTARSAEPAEPPVDPRTAKYSMIECHDGDWPVVKTFKSPEALARRIGALHGSDTTVIPFFGIALRVTEGPQRYLYLPGDKRVIQIPMYAGGPAKTHNVDMLGELTVQKDGFLGPPELAMGHITDEAIDEQMPVTTNAAVDEEDEQDD